LYQPGKSSDWRVMLVTKPSLGTAPPPDEPTALTGRNRSAWAAVANKGPVASGAGGGNGY
jgi:hypothetical protein